jgi:hypothetical protein
MPIALKPTPRPAERLGRAAQIRDLVEDGRLLACREGITQGVGPGQLAPIDEALRARAQKSGVVVCLEDLRQQRAQDLAAFGAGALHERSQLLEDFG